MLEKTKNGPKKYKELPCATYESYVGAGVVTVTAGRDTSRRRHRGN